MNKEPKNIKWKGLNLKVVDKTIYGWPVVKCPFCSKTFVRDGIQQHIYMQAKIEPYEHMMGIKKGLKHAKFYKKNTLLSKVQYFIRQWKDGDNI